MSTLKDRLNKTATINEQDGDKALESIQNSAKEATDLIWNSYEKNAGLCEKILEQLGESTDVIDEFYQVEEKLAEICKKIEKIRTKIDY